MIIRECTYTESYMNRHGPAKYTNRYGDEFTFLLNEDGDLIMEGNFEHFRFGFSNIYGVAYREYIKDTNSNISLDEFKKLVHQYNDETGTWELETDKYRKLVVTSDEYNMIDPSGGPFLDVGGTVFPTEFKNGPLSVGTISKIELRENGLFVEIL